MYMYQIVISTTTTTTTTVLILLHLLLLPFAFIFVLLSLLLSIHVSFCYCLYHYCCVFFLYSFYVYFSLLVALSHATSFDVCARLFSSSGQRNFFRSQSEDITGVDTTRFTQTKQQSKTSRDFET